MKKINGSTQGKSLHQKRKAAKAKATKRRATSPAPGIRFAVAAAYTGDCCTNAHVWVVLVRAKDGATAEAMLRKRVEAKQFACGDVIALPVSPKTKVPSTPLSGHRTVDTLPVNAEVEKAMRGKGGAS